MKSRHGIRLLVPALAVTGASFAGHGEKCSEDTQSCLNKLASKLETRAV